MRTDHLQIVKTGSNITTGAASASVAIPTDSAGTTPKYIRVCATAACYVKIGPSAVAAAAGDMLLNPYDGVTLNVNRCTHIAAIQVAAAGICQVSPLENA